MIELTAEALRSILAYDPLTGLWTWLVGTRNNYGRAGMAAGSVRPDGYRKIRIGGTSYYASRLAWLYMTGEWPKDEIDHKDRDPSNDTWENLRGATSSDNKCNRRTNSASGLKGIDWYAPLAKWRVRVNENHVGYFADIDDAVLARDSAAIAWQGDFAFLNSQENQSDS